MTQEHVDLPVADRPGAQAGPGLFLSFEGGDGVGKTTQIKRLVALLEASGVDCLVTREPGGTELGSQIRRILLHGGEVSPRAEALLYAADRAHHVQTRVRPALARGAVVITDRYLDSSVAYQGAARALGPKEVRHLSLWAAQGLLPDLTLLLDADPGTGARRAGRRAALDRLEREPSTFHVALREEFLALAAAEPERFAVIEAERSVEEVAAQVRAAVAGLIRSRVAAGGTSAGSTWAGLEAFASAHGGVEETR
ncbi:dTMP kinase [Actinomyces faecalis]|uniref:dTMP kinase n=1 Tax=Actinomyces faecalis TaxID=2722820 RepID=UPI001557936F|nr:dTMP kinase [Actinomyces faecalis]